MADSLSKETEISFISLPTALLLSVPEGICSPDEDRQLCDRCFAEKKPQKNEISLHAQLAP